MKKILHINLIILNNLRHLDRCGNFPIQDLVTVVHKNRTTRHGKDVPAWQFSGFQVRWNADDINRERTLAIFLILRVGLGSVEKVFFVIM